MHETLKTTRLLELYLRVVNRKAVLNYNLIIPTIGCMYLRTAELI